jgi:putative transposase
LADQVLLKIVCLLMRWLFSLAVLMSSGDREKNAELLALRHQNAVLRRNAGRVRYEPADRAWFAALTRFIPRRRWAEVFPVTPATLLTWHRRLTARKYDTSKRRKPGRPATVRSIARLTILWVPITSSTSCDQPIFVDHATGLSPFSDAVQVEVDRLG